MKENPKEKILRDIIKDLNHRISELENDLDSFSGDNSPVNERYFGYDITEEDIETYLHFDLDCSCCHPIRKIKILVMICKKLLDENRKLKGRKDSNGIKCTNS